MTDLTSALAHLPADKAKELHTVVQRIVATGKAQLVLLFGSYARGNFRDPSKPGARRKSDFDILAITADLETRDTLKTELSDAFRDIPTHVQLLAEAIDFVNSNLEEKQYFFTDIKREGIVLYDSGKYQLVDFKELTPTKRREIAERDFARWHELAKGFYWVYEQCDSKGEYQIASFNLQQSVEMCYTTIEMVFTHYNPHEHNLHILRERVTAIDSRVNDILPCDTDEHTELFSELNFAYIGGRYRSKEEFPVRREQLDYWSEQAKALLDLTEEICGERILDLKSVEGAV
jgi:predicted nucleotidyltransferase/HEPN domain-containing protein